MCKTQMHKKNNSFFSLNSLTYFSERNKFFLCLLPKKLSALFIPLFYVRREKKTLHVQLSSVRGALTILINNTTTTRYNIKKEILN